MLLLDASVVVRLCWTNRQNPDHGFQVADAGFQALSTSGALDAFRRERSRVVTLLENLAPRDWMRTGIQPKDGERTLLEWLAFEVMIASMSSASS